MRFVRGFAIFSAIFILVVLAALGAFILSISTNQQIASALDVQGVRATQAARAGIEWGMFQINSTAAYNFSYGAAATAVGSVHPNLRACPAAPIPSFAVFGFTVTVTCTATPAPAAVAAGAVGVGVAYVINTVGTTDFTLIGAANNTVGTVFTATGAGAGTGTVIAAAPIVYELVATACSQPNAAGNCPNTSAGADAPGNFYVERRLAVTF